MGYPLNFTGEQVNTILTQASSDSITLAALTATVSTLNSDLQAANSSISDLQGLINTANSNIASVSSGVDAATQSILVIESWRTVANASFTQQSSDIAALSAIVVDGATLIADTTYYAQIAKNSSGLLFSKIYDFASIPSALGTDAQLSDVITTINALISALKEPESI